MTKHLFCILATALIVSSLGLGRQITGKTSRGSFGPPPIVLSIELNFVEPSGNSVLDAGESGSIKLTVRNTGQGIAKNLTAKLSSQSQSKQITITPSVPVGDIAPNASATVSFQVTASENVQSQTVALSVDVLGPDGMTIVSKPISIATKERIVVDNTPPEIILTKPAELVARGMRTLTVSTEIKTADSSIIIEGIARDASGIASVLINGVEVQVKVSLQSAEFSYLTSLSVGPNQIEIKALDRSQNESKLTLVVRREEPVFAGQNFALIFAVDAYDSWPRLTNPINDARAITEELRRSYGFNSESIEDVTRDRLLSALRRYAEKKYGENDQLFIFFAGHGQFDDVLGDGYLVAKDSKLNDDIKTSYVSHSNLRTIVNNIPCKHVFLVVDACFGGTFDPLIAANLRGEDEYKEVTKTEFIQRKMKFKTRRFLTSGGKEYVPDGRPGQHSPFTRKLLEALRSYGGRDGILTINEILGYVDKVKPEPRAGEFGTNEPGSDFIFLAR